MAGKQSATHLVQYIALRGDLLRVQRWPLGALVAQGCHASTAVLHMYRDHGNVVEYLSDLDHMHKVVLEARVVCALTNVIQSHEPGLFNIPDDEALRNLSGELERNGVQHKLWVEQPEDIPTCLATIPSPKSQIQQYFKKFKLFK